MAAEYIVAAEPDAPDGYYLLHRAYLRAGKRARARAGLERGLRIAKLAKRCNREGRP